MTKAGSKGGNTLSSEVIQPGILNPADPEYDPGNKPGSRAGKDVVECAPAWLCCV